MDLVCNCITAKTTTYAYGEIPGQTQPDKPTGGKGKAHFDGKSARVCVSTLRRIGLSSGPGRAQLAQYDFQREGNNC